MLRKQLGRLGNTPYELAGLDLELSGSPFVPASVLNHLRRQAVEQLQDLQGRRRESRIIADAQITHFAPRNAPHETSLLPIELHLLVRTPEQLEAAIPLKPASITLDYLDLYGLRPSVRRVKDSGIEARVATPRVLKPGEERIVDFLRSLDCAFAGPRQRNPERPSYRRVRPRSSAISASTRRTPKPRKPFSIWALPALRPLTI